MTRETADGMDVAHDGIRQLGPGATTEVTTTGDVIAGATIDFVTLAGGYVTIGGRTTTGAIGGATTGGDIDETTAIDLCGVLKIGIAGGSCPNCGIRSQFHKWRVSSNYSFLDTL